MQEEVTQKTIALSMKTGKITGQVLQAALKKYLQHRAKSKNTLHQGKQSLKQLKRHGADLTNIEITEANIGAFKSCAKKYGVDFALRKDKTKVQILHYNRSLLDIHLKGRIFLQTLQERSQPQCITVCNTRINMIQPGQILMCGRKQINTPLSKL